MNNNLGKSINEMVEEPMEKEVKPFKPERTLLNAIDFAKNEMKRYITDPQSYGGISGLAKELKKFYNLRDDEMDYFNRALKNYVSKNKLMYGDWDR